LEGGGSFLVRADSADEEVPVEDSGPVQAGRVGDRIGRGAVEAAESLESALAPVVSMSEVVLTALARAKPREVQVEFGVELTAEAGAVVSKAGGKCHLTVTLTWAPGESDQDH
jgi:Trypsin-co-occurring domain 1